VAKDALRSLDALRALVRTTVEWVANGPHRFSARIGEVTLHVVRLTAEEDASYPWEARVWISDTVRWHEHFATDRAAREHAETLGWYVVVGRALPMLAKAVEAVAAQVTGSHAVAGTASGERSQ
jgi:hypothetical protein